MYRDFKRGRYYSYKSTFFTF